MTLEQAARPHRVALYLAPRPQSDWWRAGSRWLGRCADSGMAFDPPEVSGLPPGTVHELTAEPRRYGFHATLKPPFRLRPGVGLRELRETVDDLCGGIAPFTLPPLRVATLGDFLALRPVADNPGAEALAARCVTALQPLAAPLSPGELARRRQRPLTPEQDTLLQRWGYPWVLQQFRFHFSLTGSLQACSVAQRAALAGAAEAVFHPLPDCHVDSVAVFVEPGAGADFALLEHRSLRG